MSSIAGSRPGSRSRSRSAAAASASSEQHRHRHDRDAADAVVAEVGQRRGPETDLVEGAADRGRADPRPDERAAGRRAARRGPRRAAISSRATASHPVPAALPGVRRQGDGATPPRHHGRPVAARSRPRAARRRRRAATPAPGAGGAARRRPPVRRLHQRHGRCRGCSRRAPGGARSRRTRRCRCRAWCAPRRRSAPCRARSQPSRPRRAATRRGRLR